MTTAGHNSKELTDNEVAALKMHHLRKRMKHKADIKRVQDDMKSDANLAKADGISVTILDFGIKALNAEDKQTPVDAVMEQGRMLETLGLIPAWNGDLLADRATRSEKVFAAGKFRGMSGLDRVSEYPPGSQDDKDDLAGWQEGQRIMREDLQTAMEKRNAASAGDSKEAPAATGGDPFAGDEE